MKDKLIKAAFCSNLFCSISYPIIHKKIMIDISSNAYSFLSMLNCIVVILIINFCNKHENKIYTNFITLLKTELLLYLVLTLYVIVNKNIVVFYIIDLLITSTLSRCIICGGNKFKALYYNKDTRSIFDNNLVKYSNVASIIGFGLGAFITVPLEIALIIMAIGLVSDNMFYASAYKEKEVNYNKSH